MTTQPWRACPALLTLVAVAACAELDHDAAPETLAETSSELSVTSWSQPRYVGNADLGAAVGTVGGTTILVRTECCDGNYGPKDLAWARRTATGWTSWVVIPSQTSTTQPSLAGFNNFIYMLRQGTYNDVYLSRFDPSTNTWSASWLLPYESYTTPAIVAFQNKLWFIGNTPGTNQIWTASMSTSEVLTTAQLVPGKYTSWRPSAAVFSNRLYIAHAQLSSGKIIYSSFDGSAFSASQFVYVGPNGAAVSAHEPRIAAVNGYLHLVYRSYYQNAVKWSYFDGCEWAPEVSIGSLISDYRYALAQGGPGLVLTTKSNSSSIYVSEFTAPPAQSPPAWCGVIGP